MWMDGMGWIGSLNVPVIWAPYGANNRRSSIGIILENIASGICANLYQKGKQQQFWKDKTFSLRLIDFQIMCTEYVPSHQLDGLA